MDEDRHGYAAHVAAQGHRQRARCSSRTGSGPFNLRHRIVMAPLTRSRGRAKPGNVPSSPWPPCYYAQRALRRFDREARRPRWSMHGQGLRLDTWHPQPRASGSVATGSPNAVARGLTD